MTRTFVQLALVTTTLVLVGPALAAPPSSVALVPAPSSAPAGVAAGAAGLCGITSSDVAAIIQHYQLAPNLAEVAPMLATPLQCSAYGDLCTTIGPQNAQTYACTLWHDLRDFEPVADVQALSLDMLSSWAPVCVPDPEECAAACAPRDVLVCDGHFLGGQCHPLVVCDDPRLRPPFGFEGLVPLEPLEPFEW